MRQSRIVTGALLVMLGSSWSSSAWAEDTCSTEEKNKLPKIEVGCPKGKKVKIIIPSMSLGYVVYASCGEAQPEQRILRTKAVCYTANANKGAIYYERQ